MRALDTHTLATCGGWPKKASAVLFEKMQEAMVTVPPPMKTPPPLNSIEVLFEMVQEVMVTVELSKRIPPPQEPILFEMMHEAIIIEVFTM